MKELARELFKVSAQRVSCVQFPPLVNCLNTGIQALTLRTPSVSSVSPRSNQPREPRDLAIALIALEGGKYENILPEHCVSHLRGYKEKSTIQAAGVTK